MQYQRSCEFQRAAKPLGRLVSDFPNLELERWFLRRALKSQQLGLPGHSRALVAQAEGTEFKSLAREELGDTERSLGLLAASLVPGSGRDPASSK